MAGSNQSGVFGALLTKYASVGILVYSSDARVRSANALACHLLGRSEAQLAAAPDAAWSLLRDDQTPLTSADVPANRVRATLQPVRDQVVGVDRAVKSERVWMLVNAFPEFAATGELSEIVVTLVDITVQKRAELEATRRADEYEREAKHAREQLNETEKSFIAAISNSPDAIFVQVDGLFVFLNDAAVRLFGVADAEELVGQPVIERIHPSDRSDVAERIRLRREGALQQIATRFQFRVVRTDGKELDTDSLVMLVNHRGQRACVMLVSDVTERNKAEAEHLFYKEILEDAARIARIGGWRFDAATGEGFWTAEVARIHDLDPAVPISREAGIQYYTEESRPMIEAAVKAAVERGIPYDLELEIISAKGVRKWIRTIGRPVFEEGRVVRVRGSYQDITERKRAEEAVYANASKLEAAITSMTDAIFISDGDGKFIHFNNAFVTFHKFKSREECAKTLAEYPDFLEVFLANEEPAPMGQWAVSRALRGEVMANLEYTLRHKQTGETWIGSYSFAPIRNSDGAIVGSVVIARDITERKKAEAALRASEERFSRLFHGNPACQLITTLAEGKIIDFNDAFCRMSGYSPEDLEGRSTVDLDMWATPADRQMVLDKFQREGRVRSLEVNYKTRSGDIRTMLMSVEAIELGAGEPHVISSTLDITDRKRAEESRRQLQEQLFQAQKMESVGRLAAGVAHDFNNILMVQQGYCELVRLQLPSDDPLHAALAEIDASTERGVALTRQLLAFSRKQPLEPRLLDVNALVSNLGKMLHRLMGEDVELATILTSAPAMVKADPGHLEQVLVNLAVNARDAMPRGGKLTIEVMRCELDASETGYCMNVVPGRYVMMAVSDTGCGMDQETQRRIFEPFFTTKEVGKGTGLGLSTVYGIVQQSGGNLWVYSEPGHGTTFRVLLPFANGTALEATPIRANLERGGGELVLVVEDEPALRQLAKLLIEGIGYRVIVAASGEAAVALIEEQGLLPDLLITDVVMPGISGRVLVERIRPTLPHLQVIYMSGYTDDAMTRHGIFESRVDFLQKPFTMATLAAKIKSVLGSD